MEKPPKVCVIILNWNAADNTVRCVESFANIDYENLELVIVDNASTDSSASRIREHFPDIALLETTYNSGYTGGNNAGLRYTLENHAGYALIINNDTVLHNNHFLSAMIERMEEDKSIGIMGPTVINPGKLVQETILFAPTLFNVIRKSVSARTHASRRRDYSARQQVEAVSGVCWLMRIEAVQEIGLLDEDFFMYMEEQDYCYRAKKSGWGIEYFPVESILHFKGPRDHDDARVLRQYILVRRNYVIFLRKQFGIHKAFTAAALFLSSNILKCICSRLTGRNREFFNFHFLSELFSEIRHALTASLQSATFT